MKKKHKIDRVNNNGETINHNSSPINNPKGKLNLIYLSKLFVLYFNLNFQLNCKIEQNLSLLYAEDYSFPYLQKSGLSQLYRTPPGVPIKLKMGAKFWRQNLQINWFQTRHQS